MAPTKTPPFKVIRKNPELLSPSEPTPYVFKLVSDLDNHNDYRIHTSLIHFYRNNPSMKEKDPVSIVRSAIAKALVFYYPIAGRVREYPGQKLVVECTGEGVVFVEADADVTLNQFGDALYPPFPQHEELLLDISEYNRIINSPLLVVQVTRLQCGGFIVAYRLNHTLFDATGISLFISAVAEIARGGAAPPSTLPVWQRHLLSSHHASLTRSENDVETPISVPHPQEEIVQRSFFFGPTEIAALRQSLSPHLRNCSKFDIVAAFVWRCRTIALSSRPDEDTLFICAVDMRKGMEPPLPEGYYGNAAIAVTISTSAEKLSKSSLDYAVELVRKAKAKATNGSVRSAADLMALKERQSLRADRSYCVSDLRHMGFEQVDFGWGAGAYGGVLKGCVQISPSLSVSWYRGFKNEMGQDGIVVPEGLPLKAMEEFEKQLMMMRATATSDLNASKL